MCQGLNISEIKFRLGELSESERNVVTELIELMDEDTGLEIGEAHVDGLSGMLSQPEFTRKGDQARTLLELLEEKTSLTPILSQAVSSREMQVIIGNENPHSAMQDFSVILRQYGPAGKANGVIGVVGPTRMAYEKAFSLIQYLSNTMNRMIRDMYR